MFDSMIPKRTDIDKKYKWAIEDLYVNDEAWEQDASIFETKTDEILRYKGRLHDGAEILAEALQKNDELNMRIEKIYVYANQKLHEDTGNPTYQKFAAKAQNLMIQYNAKAAFMQPELLIIDSNKLKVMMTEYVPLKKYEQYLNDILRQKDHILSDEMEEFLANAQEIAKGPENIFSMFNNADIKFPVIEGENGEKIAITHGRFISLLESKDRRVRKEAFLGLYHTYESFQNTLASVFHNNVKQAAFFAKARHYDSNLAMYLDDSNIPVSVYENLIQTVEEYLPLLHKYTKIRKNRLGYDELHMYDLYVPIVKSAEKEYSYEDAKTLVKKGLAKMGEEYLSELQKGFDNGWIDVYENEGKRSGAYSWGAYGTHPYVLLNYQNNLKNVFTLAHEMGHALHSYYSDLNQEYTYAGYRIFVAEVASTCNESLLIRYLLENSTDREEKAYLLNYFLEQFRGTFFRQTMFAEFEQIVHKRVQNGEELTATVLKEIYRELNRKYYGDQITIDDEIAMEWARIPHFYNPFYVYQYATGFAAAIALSRRIDEFGEEAVSDYMKFLSGGSSKYPIDLLKLAGVDMTQKEPIRTALNLFGDLLEEFEKISAE